MRHLINSVMKMKDDMQPTKILLYTDNKELMQEMSDRINDLPLIISTHEAPMSSLLQRSNVHLRKNHYPPSVGINVLHQAKDLVLSCLSEGYLDSSDLLLFIVSTDIDTILSFEMEDIGVANLKDRISDRIDVRVLDAAFNIGSMIIREGREGLPAGALLTLGDANNVLKHSKESIKNPLAGCDRETLNIQDEDNKNTIKEYSMLDGAMVIDKNGYPIAAGRYLLFSKDQDVSLKEGLGGRHLAAASITHETRAIAIVVSSEGTLRIYKNGEEIYGIDPV